MVEITKKDLITALRAVDDDTVIRIMDPTSNWESPVTLDMNAGVPLIQVIVPSKDPTVGKRIAALIPSVDNLKLA